MTDFSTLFDWPDLSKKLVLVYLASYLVCYELYVLSKWKPKGTDKVNDKIYTLYVIL